MTYILVCLSHKAIIELLFDSFMVRLDCLLQSSFTFIILIRVAWIVFKNILLVVHGEQVYGEYGFGRTSG